MDIQNLAFSSGAMKGIVYIGCFKALEEYDLLKNIKAIAGTSSGGIFALLLNLGYNSKELTNLALGIDFTLLKDITTDSILSFLTNYGFDTCNKLINIIKILIKKKVDNENISFLELYNKTKIKLILTGTCLDNKCIEYFSYKTCPDMKVIDAIRISICIPLVYNKFEYNDKMYIDGAILNDYPIQLFDQYKEKTLGFLIHSDKDNKIIDITSYIYSIINCMSRKLQSYQLLGFEEQTIKLKVNLHTLKFDLNKTEKLDIINYGYKQTKEYVISKLEKIEESIKKEKKKESNLEKEIELLLKDIDNDCRLVSKSSDNSIIIDILNNLIKKIENENKLNNIKKNVITLNSKNGELIEIECPL